MKGYKFTTEESAINAILQIDIIANLPKGNNDTTKNWTSYNYANLNEPPFYYIRHDEVAEQALGVPEELNIVFEELI